MTNWTNVFNAVQENNLRWYSLKRFDFDGTEYVNTTNAALYLGASVVTIKRAAASGHIVPTVSTPSGNYYTRATLDAYRPSLKRRGGQPGKRSKR